MTALIVHEGSDRRRGIGNILSRESGNRLKIDRQRGGNSRDGDRRAGRVNTLFAEQTLGHVEFVEGRHR
ncbi:hypothetical protein [Streptomyces sp. bgisy027]|uniref:hypothetical protein n=1 Tax=Streptomyces sp. bgisy027 TaxID=3413770 RepID=UPI003D71BD2E